jgi:hypothetical protein
MEKDKVEQQPDHGACQATHDEICDGLLSHYESLATECHHWSNGIPRAIEFYRKYCGGKLSNDKLYEKLAAIEHERWSDWQKYVHSVCNPDDIGNLIIPFGLVDHWERQIRTPYAKLSEKEKDSDREQVDRYWHLVQTMRDPDIEG